ncbi:hypothetical protein QPM17_21675 [Marinobacter sp. TBZ242]|uniref:Uncharacterized protein n=1 Tax=Marinobacter azerbaijanicus TaxID=3050455 RepID=A0ABT7IHV4_9GAMM|nr:hypothetical protein [Marinobacter sp. TBZ242]MDL0433759.1 hypothetical protein [Marinobacter sp. TBZ242]
MVVFSDHDIQILVDDLNDHASLLQEHGLRLEAVDPNASRAMLAIAHELWEMQKTLGDGRRTLRRAPPEEGEPNVKVHHTSTGPPYVRIRDIPEMYRDDFMRYLRGAARPVVDGETGPVAFEVDWLDWLHDRRPDRGGGRAP